MGPLKCFSGQLVGPLLFFLKVPPHPPVRSYANEHFAFIFVELDLWLGWNMEWRAHYLKRYRPLVRRSQMAVCWGVLPLVLGSHQNRQQSQSDLNCCPDCRGTVSNSGIFQESSQNCSIFTAYTATIYAQCQKIIGCYLYCFHDCCGPRPRPRTFGKKKNPGFPQGSKLTFVVWIYSGLSNRKC